MKKTIALCLAILLTLCLSAACAEDWAFFGRLAAGENADARLAGLQEKAETVSVTLGRESFPDVAFGQAVYDGTHIWLSYRIAAAMDKIKLHEGAPGDRAWDGVLKGWIVGDQKVTPLTPDVKKELDWLDGKSQHWLEYPNCLVCGFLMLEDNTRVPCTGEDEMMLADGTVLGWKEFTLPEERAEDSLCVLFTVGYTREILFQDFTTFRLAFDPTEEASAGFVVHRQ